MDVVYKLANGSKHKDLELRYSLRSLSLYKDLGNIFIIGYCPDFIDKSAVHHIPQQDPYTRNKDANLINKLIRACMIPYLSEDFLNFSDDQLFLREVSDNYFEKPHVVNSYLEKIRNVSHLTKWERRLKRTVDHLELQGKKTNCYESHVPCKINKHSFPEAVFKYAYGEDIGMCGNTLYFNTINAKGKVILGRNSFYHLKAESERSFIDEKTTGITAFSYVEKAMNGELIEFLRDRFPKKSQYEK